MQVNNIESQKADIVSKASSSFFKNINSSLYSQKFEKDLIEMDQSLQKELEL